MKNVLCLVLEKYEAQVCTIHSSHLRPFSLNVRSTVLCWVSESSPVFQSMHESEQVASLPELLALAQKMSMNMQTPSSSATISKFQNLWKQIFP